MDAEAGAKASDGECQGQYHRVSVWAGSAVALLLCILRGSMPCSTIGRHVSTLLTDSIRHQDTREITGSVHCLPLSSSTGNRNAGVDQRHDADPLDMTHTVGPWDRKRGL